MAELQKNFVTKIEGWADLASGHSLLYSSVAKLYPALCYRLDCSTPSFLCFTISRSSLKLISIESVMPSNHLILCCPHLLLPLTFPRIRVFSNDLPLFFRWPKYWSFSFICFKYKGSISQTLSCHSGCKPDRGRDLVYYTHFCISLPGLMSATK